MPPQAPKAADPTWESLQAEYDRQNGIFKDYIVSLAKRGLRRAQREEGKK